MKRLLTGIAALVFCLMITRSACGEVKAVSSEENGKIKETVWQDENGQPADTRTQAQRDTLLDLLIRLKQQFPNALIFGHNEFNKSKPCPCFDAEEYRMVFARR